jgi:hypothetical protein
MTTGPTGCSSPCGSVCSFMERAEGGRPHVKECRPLSLSTSPIQCHDNPPMSAGETFLRKDGPNEKGEEGGILTASDDKR